MIRASGAERFLHRVDMYYCSALAALSFGPFLFLHPSLKSDTWNSYGSVQISPLGGHRDSVAATGGFLVVFVLALVMGASIPIEDFIDFDIVARDGNHQGVADIRRGFGYGSVVEDGCVWDLLHPPANEILDGSGVTTH